MKILIVSFLALAIAQQTIIERLHSTHVIDDNEHETITTITPIEDADPKLRYEKMLETLLHMNNDQHEKDLIGCKKSSGHDFFQFAFETAGKIGQNDINSISLLKFDDDCYSSMDVHYTYSPLFRRVTVTFTPGTKKTVGECREFYLIGTPLNYNIITIKSEKPHKVHFNLLSEKQLDAFQTYGAYIFRTCDNLENWFGDLLMTLELFVGGLSHNPHWGPVFGSKPAPWMVRSNVEFIARSTGHVVPERNNVFVDLQDYEVGNGDFLAITRFDGLDQLIEWGTGSRVGHSAVVFEIDGEMQVVESQDAWYWPKKSIQRNTWKEWKQYAINAGFMVAVLPLSAESKAKWNQSAAEEWFRRMEGEPYGYHNFIFGWLDTAKDNFPKALSAELATHLFSFLEKIVEGPFKQLVGEGLNKRLQTEGLTIAECAIEAARRGIEIGDLYAMVEKDEWVYSDGPSYVCSAFAAGLYKAAGLFDGMDIQATEFTPRDVYMLDIYDKDYVVPEKCKVNDPELPYCQIMGTHKIILEGYNTIKPYAHMNEHCPSIGPEYERPDGC